MPATLADVLVKSAFPGAAPGVLEDVLPVEALGPSLPSWELLEELSSVVPVHATVTGALEVLRAG